MSHKMSRDSMFTNRLFKAFLFTAVLFMCGNAMADDITKVAPNYRVTEAIYDSSATCGTAMVFSTISIGGTFVFGVDVTSAGAPGSRFQMFDSNNSTQVTNTAMVSTIDTTINRFHIINMFASSGTAIYNSNTLSLAPACVTVFFQSGH